MAKTLQEILAKNNIKIGETTMVSNNQVETTSNNTSVMSNNTASNVDNGDASKKVTYQTLMSSDDVDNLDVKQFMGSVSSRPHIEEDIYDARCVKIEKVMGQNFEGVPEEKFCWHFDLLRSSSGTEVSPKITLRYYTRLAFGEKSNNYKVYGCFFGETPSQYNILECIGNECRVNVVDNTPQNGGQVYSKIKDILKAKRK